MEKVEVTPVIGLPQLAGWSHVVSNRDKTIACAFAIEGSHASNVGRDVADELEHTSPENAAAFYAFLTRLHREVSQKECTLYLAASFLLNGKGVFIGLNGTIILHRHDKLGKLVQAEDAFQVIEGSWHPDDFFILMTSPATSLLNEIEQKIRQGFDQDTVIASLVPSVHMVENSSLHAVAFARKHEHTVSAEEEPAGTAETMGLAIELEVGEPATEATTEPAATGALATPQLEWLANSQPAATPATATSVTQPPQPPVTERLKPVMAQIAQGTRQLAGAVTRIVPRVVQPFTRVGRPFSGEVYVNSLSGRKLARKIIPLVVLVAVVAGGSGYYGYQRRTARAEVVAQLAQITGNSDALTTLASTDPITARAEMNDILSALQEYKQQAPTGYGIPALIDTRLTEVQQAYDAISGMEELNTLEPFFDLRLIASDFVANEIVAGDNELILIDSGKKQLLTLSLPNKQYETVSLEEREPVRDLAVTESGAAVLAGGVYQYSLPTGEATQVIANDEQVRLASKILFFNGAYYVVSPEKQNIFRYRPNESGAYEVAVGWVRPGEGIDFSQVQRVAIDGDIWLSTKDGKVYRYNSGRQETFTPTGLTTAFAHSLWLVTSSLLDNVYVLEPDNRRVVVLTKEGEFLREIQSASLATATGLAVSEDEQAAYVISGSLVYQLSL